MRPLLLAGVAVIVFGSAAGAAPPGDPAARCAALASALDGKWPEAGTTLTEVAFRPAGPAPVPPRFAAIGPPPVLPLHCEATGTMRRRTGIDGQPYAIRFHVRMPADWNGRLLMQGGGGTNGELGDAIGRTGAAMAPALVQGFAVVSQDSGHDNAVNTVAARGGASAFGFDPEARADYGGTSLPLTAAAARAVVGAFYGAAPKRSYFYGCSKGGQEGMMLAQRYPDLFDGIVAGAPGFALPRAAMAEAWNTQRFADVVRAKGEAVTPATLAASFSDGDLRLVGDAILAACDAADGAKDGIVAAFRQCTSARVLPELAKVRCGGAKTAACLAPAQITALEQVHGGARDGKGRQIYPGFPWDAGWADMGWRIWMIGSADGKIPSINVAMGAPSLFTVFTSPPTSPGTGLQDYLDGQLRFDFDRDPAKVDARVAPFPRSAWEDIGARSPDLDRFAAHGGRMIVPHGVSDPVFSINDTIGWWEEVDMRRGGKAAEVVRLFPVPGMGHCQGGPATDRYDALGALVDWVEKGTAPESLPATAGPMSPWPDRARPLCRYPLVARTTPGARGQAEVVACRPS